MIKVAIEGGLVFMLIEKKLEANRFFRPLPDGKIALARYKITLMKFDGNNKSVFSFPRVFYTQQFLE